MHQTFYLSLFLRMLVRGATGLKLAFEKPFCVYGFGFPDWDYSLGSTRIVGLGRFKRQIEGVGGQADLGS